MDNHKFLYIQVSKGEFDALETKEETNPDEVQGMYLIGGTVMTEQDKVFQTKLSGALIDLQFISDKATGKGFSKDDIDNVRDIILGLYRATFEHQGVPVEPYKYTKYSGIEKKEG